MYTVEIRPADGGEDAARFASELSSAIMSGARRSGIDATTTTLSTRAVTLTLTGDPG